MLRTFTIYPLLVVLCVFRLIAGKDFECQYENGNGVGKREYRVGKINSPIECTKRCIAMKTRRADVNGVIYSPRYRVCYCIAGMLGRRGNPIWKSCFLIKKGGATDTAMTVETRSRAFTCSYKSGFGFGGSQYFIGPKQNDLHCAADCYDLRNSKPNINGASFGLRNKECICESNMKGRERNYLWKSCYLKSNSPTARPTPTPIQPRSTIKPTKKKRDRKRKKGKRRKNRKKNKKRKKTTTIPKHSTKLPSITPTTKQTTTTRLSTTLPSTTPTTKQTTTTRLSTTLPSTTPTTKETSTTRLSRPIAKETTTTQLPTTTTTKTTSVSETTATLSTTRSKSFNALATTKQSERTTSTESTTTKSATTRSHSPEPSKIAKSTKSAKVLSSNTSTTRPFSLSDITPIERQKTTTTKTTTSKASTLFATKSENVNVITTTEQPKVIAVDVVTRTDKAEVTTSTESKSTSATSTAKADTIDVITVKKQPEVTATTESKTTLLATTDSYPFDVAISTDKPEGTTTKESKITSTISTTKVVTIDVSSTTKQPEITVTTESTISMLSTTPSGVTEVSTIKVEQDTNTEVSTTGQSKTSKSTEPSPKISTESRKIISFITEPELSTVLTPTTTEPKSTAAAETTIFSSSTKPVPPSVLKTNSSADIITETSITTNPGQVNISTRTTDQSKTTKPTEPSITFSKESTSVVSSTTLPDSTEQPDISTPAEHTTTLSAITGSKTTTLIESTTTISTNTTPESGSISTKADIPEVTRSETTEANKTAELSAKVPSILKTNGSSSAETDRDIAFNTTEKPKTTISTESSEMISSTTKPNSTVVFKTNKQLKTTNSLEDSPTTISTATSDSGAISTTTEIKILKITEPLKVNTTKNLPLLQTKHNRTTDSVKTLTTVTHNITSDISKSSTITQYQEANRTTISPVGYTPGTDANKVNRTLAIQTSTFSAVKSDSEKLATTTEQPDTTTELTTATTEEEKTTIAVSTTTPGKTTSFAITDENIMKTTDMSMNKVKSTDNELSTTTTSYSIKTDLITSSTIEEQETPPITTESTFSANSSKPFSTTKTYQSTETTETLATQSQNNTAAAKILVTASNSTNSSNRTLTKEQSTRSIPSTSTPSDINENVSNHTSKQEIIESTGQPTTLASTTKSIKTNVTEINLVDTTAAVKVNATEEALHTTTKEETLSNFTSKIVSRTTESNVKVQTTSISPVTDNSSVLATSNVSTESTITENQNDSFIRISKSSVDLLKTTRTSMLHSTADPILRNLTINESNSTSKVDEKVQTTTRSVPKFTKVSNTLKPIETVKNVTTPSLSRNLTTDTTSRPRTTLAAKDLTSKQPHFSSTVQSISQWSLQNKKYEFKEFVCDHGIMRIVLSINPNIDAHFAHNLTLRDPQCAFVTSQVNMEMTLETDYEKCGATIQQNEEYIVYKNQLVDWNAIDVSADDKVYRPMELMEEVNVHCKVEKNYDTSLGGAFKPKHSSIVQITKTKYGKMELSMSLYKSFEFNNKYITREFPVVIDMTDHLFVELAMNTTSDGLLISPQHCYATTTNDPEDNYRYSVFKERCPRDPTFELVKKSNTRFRFRIKVFDFLKNNKGIYMHCASTICESNSRHPMCQFGCEAIRSDRKHKRTDLHDHKGSVSGGIYTVSSGYVEVKDRNLGNDVERSRKSGMKDENDNSITSNKTFLMLLITLCVVTLIAVVSLSMAVMFYRQRRQQQGNDSSSELVTHL